MARQSDRDVAGSATHGVVLKDLKFPSSRSHLDSDGLILIFFRLEHGNPLIGKLLIFDAESAHGGILLYFLFIFFSERRKSTLSPVLLLDDHLGGEGRDYCAASGRTCINNPSEYTAGSLYLEYLFTRCVTSRLGSSRRCEQGFVFPDLLGDQRIEFLVHGRQQFFVVLGIGRVG